MKKSSEFSSRILKTQELLELQRRKDMFISTASHELKTPVATIKGFNQILQKMLSNQPKPLYFLSKMQTHIDRLASLINDLLDVSKIQSNKLELKKEIIERHEGKIWVESEKGKGSTFSFKIPVASSN